MSKSLKLNPTVSLRRLRELECKHCGQLFYTDLQLERHERSHSKDKKPFLCGVCGVTSTTRNRHVAHLRSHRQHRYPCDLCGRAFAKISDVKRHRKLHDKEKCPRSAASLAEPGVELPETSSDLTAQNCTLVRSLQLKPEDPGPSTAWCVGDTASTSASPPPVLTATVDAHLQLEGQKSVHYEDRPFPCQMCGSRFHSQYLYDEHLRRHIGKRRFSCCVCSHTFSTLSTLKLHFLRHDKKQTVFDQPSGRSGTAPVEPNTEPSETALSSDTSQNDSLDHSLQLKPEGPGPSTVFAPPPLSKDTDTLSPRAPPSVVEPAAQTPPQLFPGPPPKIFASFGLTSAFLEVKWNYKLLQEKAACMKKY